MTTAVSLKSAADRLYICTQEPANFTEASSTYALGNVNLGAGAVFPGAIAVGTNGRKLTTLNISDGAVSGDGTANNWAITDGANLLVVGALSSAQVLTNGNTFSMAPFDVNIRSQ